MPEKDKDKTVTEEQIAYFRREIQKTREMGWPKTAELLEEMVIRILAHKEENP